jgi:DNA-binding TFAR19-related protein (PDSD5 family)
MDKQLTEVKRGEQASQVLDNPLFQESVEKVREGIIRSMATSPLGDSETHNRLVIAMQLLNQIEKQLTDVIQTGKMAAIQTDNKLKLFR